MTKLKISGRMHLFIIISAIFVALGLAVGLVFQFVSNGYFNYSNEYGNYNCVVVNYASVDLSAFGDENGIKKICDNRFEAAGATYVAYEFGETNGGGELVFKFLTSEDINGVRSAAANINKDLNEAKDGYDPSGLSNAVFQEVKTQVGGNDAFVYGSIAIAAAIVLQCLYFAVRYKLTMAFATLVAHLHNIAIYVSFVALTRLPVGSEVFSFGVLTVLATILGTCCFFGKMRRNIKSESLAKYDLHEQTDICASESFVPVSISSLVTLVCSLVLLGVLSFNFINLLVVLSYTALVVFAVISFYYGTMFFTPSIYTGMRKVGEKFKANRLAKKTTNKVVATSKKVDNKENKQEEEKAE